MAKRKYRPYRSRKQRSQRTMRNVALTLIVLIVGIVILVKSWKSDSGPEDNNGTEVRDVSDVLPDQGSGTNARQETQAPKRVAPIEPEAVELVKTIAEPVK